MNTHEYVSGKSQVDATGASETHVESRFDGLVQIPGYRLPVYASAGAEARARSVATRCAKAYDTLRDLLGREAECTVVVLNPLDWQRLATYPGYGMPHYIDDRTLVVASETNNLWDDMAPPLEILPPVLAERARLVYAAPGGKLDFARFFDLVAVHEMGHLFQHQARLTFPRLWLMEYFCNLCMTTYVATMEPETLPALETYPQMIIAGGSTHLRFRTLDDFERLYVNVGPVEYGWYQSNLIVAGKRLFDAMGAGALRRLWQVSFDLPSTITDDVLAQRLRDEVHPEAASILEGEFGTTRLATGAYETSLPPS